MSNKLYYIAIIPSELIQKEVTVFKQYCADHFQARHAFKSPPHITIIPPFRLQVTAIPALGETLRDFAGKQSSFNIELKDFDCFPPSVIFVDVRPNPELTNLAHNLADHLENQLGLKQRKEFPFHPHMTIAHRDLKETIFPLAWAYFEQCEYEAIFYAKGLTLLQHENKIWKVAGEFAFDV